MQTLAKKKFKSDVGYISVVIEPKCCLDLQHQIASQPNRIWQRIREARKSSIVMSITVFGLAQSGD